MSNELIVKIQKAVKNHGTALQNYVLVKRIIKVIEEDVKEFLKDANEEYMAACDEKGHLLVDGCRLTTNPQKKKWEYAHEILVLEETLKMKKKLEEVTKVAKDVTPKPSDRDSQKESFFRVAVN